MASLHRAAAAFPRLPHPPAYSGELHALDLRCQTPDTVLLFGALDSKSSARTLKMARLERRAFADIRCGQARTVNKGHPD